MPFNAFNSVAKLPKKTGGPQPVRWVAVGQSGFEIAKSFNGTSYIGVTNTIFGGNGGRCIEYGNGLWVAGGQYGFAYSPDGNTWTITGESIFNTSVIGIKYANGLWVATGQGTSNTIATSTNGIAWTGRGNTIFSVNGKGITYGNGLWVVAGYGGNTIATSSDNGNTWAGQNNIFINYCIAITYGNGTFVVSGYGGNSIATSTDGLSWSGRTSTNINFGTASGLAYGNGLFVAVTNGCTSNTIATSPDGITWTGRGNQFFNDINQYGGAGIAYGKDDIGNPLWVALGYPSNTLPKTTIATSSDGITWTGRGATLINSARGAAYNSSLG